MSDSVKRCIFHIPNHIDEKGTSGSQVRPRRMLQGFRDLGYDVDVVMGYGRERKESIKKIKNNIKQGVKYDFLYSENSTMPTLLTEENHLPMYPFLDFGFFKFCKKNGIKIGLFYRDIYWRFPSYKEKVHGIKYLVAALAYRYDLNQYCNLLDIFYVPNKRVDKYVKRKQLSRIMKELPPGSEYNEQELMGKEMIYLNRLDKYDGEINLFYVGGIGGQYNFIELIKGIKDIKSVYLTVCCRPEDWKANHQIFESYLTDRIEIVHKFGEDLIEYYQKSDICLVYFKTDIYREMAVPVKLFEYLSYGIPVIASEGNPAGDFVKENNIGWTIPYGAEDIKKLLLKIVENYQEVYEKHKNCLVTLNSNRWKDRAKKVQDDILSKNRI